MEANFVTETRGARPVSTPPEIEARERAWWDEFAELEERITWVQPAPIQRILRGHYLRQIIRLTPPKGRILELGCGTGWLCLLLARLGAESVCGVDFSPTQIARARADASVSGLQGVEFYCADGTTALKTVHGQFDCIIVHGFLHHLNAAEIHRTIANIPSLLKANGVFIVFEPILHAGDGSTTMEPSCWERWQRELEIWAKRGAHSGWRKTNADEQKWRDLLARRVVGKSPHGPSPKEMPFAEGELDTYLAPHFRIVRREHCMAVSHLVVQEWLLRACANPVSTRIILPIVARIAAWLDRQILSRESIRPGFWTFTMFICQQKAVAHA